MKNKKYYILKLTLYSTKKKLYSNNKVAYIKTKSRESKVF